MNRKVVIIASAVIAFFAGAIWVSEVPVVAPLVAFLEVCAGFGCGFFYNQLLKNEELQKLQKEVETLKSSAEKKVRITTRKSVVTKSDPKEENNKGE